MSFCVNTLPHGFLSLHKVDIGILSFLMDLLDQVYTLVESQGHQ